MIVPAELIVVLYSALAVFNLWTARGENKALILARVWLSIGLLGWAGFHVWIVVTGGDLTPSVRVLARWLHITLATGIGLMVWARWSLQKKLNE